MLKVPAGHTWGSRLVVVQKLPGKHARQAAWPASEKVPASQATTEDPLVGHATPAGQGIHSFWPVLGWYPYIVPMKQSSGALRPLLEHFWLTPQSVHFCWPVSLLKVPFGHRVQFADPLMAEKLPAGHGVCVSAFSVQDEPAGHLVHLPAFSFVVYEPAAHGVHLSEPPAEKVPAGQGCSDLHSPAQEWPEGHGAHPGRLLSQPLGSKYSPAGHFKSLHVGGSSHLTPFQLLIQVHLTPSHVPPFVHSDPTLEQSAEAVLIKTANVHISK